MVTGDKTAYSSRQKKQAHHIEMAYEKHGIGKKEAEKRGWATVNKLNGAGKPSTSKPASSKKAHSSSTSKRGSAVKNHLSSKNPISSTIKKTQAKSTKGATSLNAHSKASGTLARKKPIRATAAKRTATPAAKRTATSAAKRTATSAAKRTATPVAKRTATARPATKSSATTLRANSAKRPAAKKATTAKRSSATTLRVAAAKRHAAPSLRAGTTKHPTAGKIKRYYCETSWHNHFKGNCC